MAELTIKEGNARVGIKSITGTTKTIRLYPYELINQKASKALVQASTTSIITATQLNFVDQEQYHNFSIDENGFYYFEVILNETQLYALDITTDTSDFGEKLVLTKTAQVLTNHFYEANKFDEIIVSIDKPFKFSLKEEEQDHMYLIENMRRADQFDYEESLEGELEQVEFSLTPFISLVSSIPYAKVIFTDQTDIKEKVIKVIGSRSGVDIGFQKQSIIGQIQLSGTSVTKNGTEILGTMPTKTGIASNVLLQKEFDLSNILGALVFVGSIKSNMYVNTNLVVRANKTLDVNNTQNTYRWIKTAKVTSGLSGVINVEKELNPTEIQTEVIPLLGSMIPFKFTPISTDTKLTMYADWFDYDTTLPLFIARKFLTPQVLDTTFTLADNSKVSLFPQDEDWKLIIDMLTFTAAAVDNFSKMPVITDQTSKNYGSIDPSIRLGHAGLKVGLIASKNPSEVIDGMFRSHLIKHPDLNTNYQRKVILKSVICALSANIASSYAIAGGINSFNAAYLPWYLDVDETSGVGLDYTASSSTINNPDIGKSGTVTTFTIPVDTKFSIKTIYFKEGFTNPLNKQAKNELVLPAEIDTSSTIAVQTDRKFTLPSIEAVIEPTAHVPFPGDINPSSGDNLKFNWFLPLSSSLVFESLLNNKIATIQEAAGKTVTFKLPDTPYGYLPTQNEINQLIHDIYTGTIVQRPTVSIQKSSVINSAADGKKNVRLYFVHPNDSTRTVDFYVNDMPSAWFPSGGRHTITNAEIADFLRKKLDFKSGNAIEITHNNMIGIGHIVGPVGHQVTVRETTGDVSFRFLKNTFARDAQIKITRTSEVIKIEDRIVDVTKTEWVKILNSINIDGRSFSNYFITSEKELSLKNLNEIIIKSVWGDFIKIYTNDNKEILIPLFNKHDETIAEQRILFV